MSTHDTDVSSGISSPKAIVRFSGECRGCEKDVQATVSLSISAKTSTNGGRVRCSNCETTNYYDREDIPTTGEIDD